MSALAWLALVVVAAALGYAVRGRRERAAQGSPKIAADAPPPAASLAPPAATATSPHACAACAHANSLDDDRAGLFRALAEARADTARYRQVVVDLERNAPPPLLDAPGTPDDLKLIVGVGPALERMLYQMGIGTYREIARLSERQIDEIEARLAEFPGRVRRDGWVTQARALHAAKYGTAP
jgi:predicted flap endonuclease-1-like 5' DNA nuclease